MHWLSVQTRWQRIWLERSTYIEFKQFYRNVPVLSNGGAFVIASELALMIINRWKFVVQVTLCRSTGAELHRLERNLRVQTNFMLVPEAWTSLSMERMFGTSSCVFKSRSEFYVLYWAAMFYSANNFEVLKENWPKIFHSAHSLINVCDKRLSISYIENI